MLLFKRLAKVSSLSAITSDDRTTTIDSLYANFQINRCVYLLIAGPENDYVLDLDAVMALEAPLPAAITTVGELVESYLTPQLLYSYQTNKFNFNRYIRNFPAENVEETVNISDVVIWFNEFKLNRTLPVINGKLYPCVWIDDKIYIPDAKDVLIDNPSWSFLSLVDAESIIITSLVDLQDNEWVVPPGHKPILVLDGNIHFDDRWIYSTNGKITLNDSLISDNPSLQQYNTITDIITDPLSFVIFVQCTQLYAEETSAIKLDDKLYQFCTSYKGAKPIDFVCINKLSSALVRAVDVEELYHDIKLPDDPYTHYVYTENAGIDIKMVQFTIT